MDWGSARREDSDPGFLAALFHCRPPGIKKTDRKHQFLY